MSLPLFGGPSCEPLLVIGRLPLGLDTVEKTRRDAKLRSYHSGNLPGNLQNIEIIRLVQEKLTHVDRFPASKGGFEANSAPLMAN
jgi:hypothetical protein